MKLSKLWKNYNESSALLNQMLGRTNNIVAEYAEFISNEYLNGEILTASSASSDIIAPNGDLYQVKSRKIYKSMTTSLGIIRSWDFDYLFVILFDKNGLIIKGLICSKSISKKYAKYNSHENGWKINTTNDFLNDINHNDVTDELKKINKE